MAQPNPSAAGAPLALAIIAGAVIGSVMHQALIGAIAGTVLGIVFAIVLWLRDRSRIGR